MPDMDKCACGRWKTQGSPRCNHCKNAVVRARITPEGRAKRVEALKNAPRRGPHLTLPGHLYTKAAEMRNQGLSWMAIGQILGVSDRDTEKLRQRLSRMRQRDARRAEPRP